jgi:hypothetical protein
MREAMSDERDEPPASCLLPEVALPILRQLDLIAAAPPE